MYNSVLIVDDDPLEITILSAYFNALGVSEIHSATDPASVLKKLGNALNNIDLVVSDLQMPHMDGIEFLRHLKAMNYCGKLAIVSGVGEVILEHSARLANMHNLNLIGHIAKPLTKSTMDKVFLAGHETQDIPSEQNDVIITQEEFSHALKAECIRPYYQPKVNINTGKVVGAESLARWIRADGTVVMPVNFIEFAENCGRIEELTLSLYKQVLVDLQKFLQFDPNQVFAINLSPKMLKNVSLPDRLCGMSNDMGIKAENISFEITENSILNLNALTLEVFSRLRINGFEVAIDDFGTGSSNIQTLRDFPYSELKIDRSFVSTAHSNEFSLKTLNAAVSLAKEMNLRTVAEGVETRRDWEIVKQAGVDLAQGYLISRALDPTDYLEFIANFNSRNDHQRKYG